MGRGNAMDLLVKGLSKRRQELRGSLGKASMGKKLRDYVHFGFAYPEGS